MRLSFLKSFKGHDMEFVRLMYPLRYEIFVRIENANPLKFRINKDERGKWSITGDDKKPVWLDEISEDIYKAIEENEADAVKK